MPDWPTNLPPFIMEGRSYTPVSNTMPNSPEVGEPLTRRRFTGELIETTGSLVVTYDQLKDFRIFWRDTLEHGSLRFTRRDPMFGELVDAIFMAPPAYTRIGNKYRIDVSLRLIA